MQADAHYQKLDGVLLDGGGITTPLQNICGLKSCLYFDSAVKFFFANAFSRQFFPTDLFLFGICFPILLAVLLRLRLDSEGYHALITAITVLLHYRLSYQHL
jgi:hypothetical protein